MIDRFLTVAVWTFGVMLTLYVAAGFILIMADSVMRA